MNQKALARLSSLANIRHHQQQLQDIADANGGTRASGTPGFDRSADYVADVLKRAGLKVTRQEFEFPFFQETGTPEFERISPNPTVYSAGPDFVTMQYSAGGNVEAVVQGTTDIQIPPGPTPSSSNSGCEDADFAGFVAGRIALIQRGTCFFIDKVLNAQEAGAAAAIIFNEGQVGRTDASGGTLGQPVNIPVIFTTFAIGKEFYDLRQQNPVARVEVFALSETRTTENVFGETRFGSKNHVVVVGAHLDSVLEGPGINDNGSGTAVILDIAQKHWSLFPRNKLRFAFWGAEESGLLGSEHYVADLDANNPDELARIMLNLNFDMMGSPNFVRFVYDGDGSGDPENPVGPPGSDKIEQVFERFFDFRGLQTEPTAFDGRSDYGPFIAEGIDIPAGGLFSGAEVLKTAEQVAIYGGTEGVAYDFCYHEACDTFENVSEEGLKQLAQGAAFSVLWWSFDRLPPREPAATVSLRSTLSASSSSEYKGPFLQK